MVRIWDETCDNAKNREWIDLHVGSWFSDLLLVERDKSVVFFIHIKVLNYAFFEEVREILESQCQVVDMLLC